jgi:putative zinc finger/helix-turn-helix YgiT family protein
MKCMECGGNLIPSSDPIEYSIRGEKFLISGIEYEKCDNCGEEELDLKQVELLSKKANAIYRENHGLLKPEEIQSIREKYGFTQEEFQEILGVGKTTLSRWETGSIMQPATANTLLRVLRKHPLAMKDLADERGYQLKGHITFYTSPRDESLFQWISDSENTSPADSHDVSLDTSGAHSNSEYYNTEGKHGTIRLKY